MFLLFVELTFNVDEQHPQIGNDSVRLTCRARINQGNDIEMKIIKITSTSSVSPIGIFDNKLAGLGFQCGSQNSKWIVTKEQPEDTDYIGIVAVFPLVDETVHGTYMCSTTSGDSKAVKILPWSKYLFVKGLF